MPKYILAIDQGTSSSRAFLFDQKQNIVATAQEEFTQYFPQAGWVEHDAEEIWQSVENCIKKCLESSSIKAQDIAGIGLTNQRETTLVWDKKTGTPIHKAIVWQSRQTEGICQKLKEQNLEEIFHAKTGLLIDSYFSGPKIRWILDHCQAQERAEKGELLFGTIDTWLLWKLTGGNSHATDYSNASRTLLFNIHQLTWDDQLLQALNIPPALLPTALPSSGHFGYSHCGILGKAKIPICGVAGDQQAALFGQKCLEQGSIKNTYGTGCFTLMNTGEKAILSQNGLLTTIAWGIDGKVFYALEGSVFVAGSAVQWLRDALEIIDNAQASEALANQLDSNEGVFIVPAFTGLGTPYWQSQVRGACFGLTRGSDRRHFCRAVLEAIAYQSRDLIEAMSNDSGIELKNLKVDGGGTNNQFLMQFQSDLLDIEIHKPESVESSVYGAATLAGLGCGLWNKEELMKNERIEIYRPKEEKQSMDRLYRQWQKAVQAAILFSKE